MKVKVKSFATLREVIDKELDMDLPDGMAVSGLLDILCKNYKGLVMKCSRRLAR